MTDDTEKRDVTKSSTGVWDGPARLGLSHYGRLCRAKLCQSLMIIAENEFGLIVQFDSLQQPQHLACLHGDVARNPDIDWSNAS